MKESPEECFETTGAGKSFGCIGACNFVANELIWGKVKFFPPRLYRVINNVIIDKKNISSKHQHMQSCTTFVMTVLYNAIFSGFFNYTVLM